MPGRQTYVMAVRRERREDAPADWLDRVRAIDGVTLVNGFGRRAQVEADDDGLRRLRDELGAYCHIEPVIVHHRQ